MILGQRRIWNLFLSDEFYLSWRAHCVAPRPVHGFAHNDFTLRHGEKRMNTGVRESEFCRGLVDLGKFQPAWPLVCSSVKQV